MYLFFKVGGGGCFFCFEILGRVLLESRMGMMVDMLGLGVSHIVFRFLQPSLPCFWRLVGPIPDANDDVF